MGAKLTKAPIEYEIINNASSIDALPLTYDARS